jgi:hypothetical protein
MMHSFYIGWTSDAYRVDLLPDPEAPSNYKDPAKIAAAVAAKKEKQEASARFHPFYGKLSSVCLLSPTGDVLFQHYGPGENLVEATAEQGVDIGSMFTECLTNMFKFPAQDDQHGQLEYNNEPAQLVGEDVKDALKMAAMEALAAGTLSPGDIPPRLWYGRSAFCLDPYEVVGSGVPGFDRVRADTFFRFSFEATDYVDHDNGVPSAHYNALRAKHVAEASGLVRSLVTA